MPLSLVPRNLAPLEKRSNALFPRLAAWISSTYDRAGNIKIDAYRVRVARQHRLYSVPRDLSEIRIVDPGGSQVRDIAVAALVGADV